MKQVLIIDESPLFREYIKERLEEFEIEVTTAVNGLDGIIKIRSLLPDALILDSHLSRKSCRDVLVEKKANPNTARIPVILTAQKIDKNKIQELAQFNVRKVFSKPIRVDVFYRTLSEILGTEMPVDTTPCVLEAHVNDNVIFIEIAHGLNREKIDILRFKLVELASLYGIKDPRILLMMSDMELSFVDGPNIDKLMKTIVHYSNAKNKHIKVLTHDKITKDFVEGHSQFADIEVASNLQDALDGLLSEGLSLPDADQTSLITEKILVQRRPSDVKEEIQMRFEAESATVFAVENGQEAGKGLEIAVVDDDFVIRALVRNVFSSIAATVTEYANGREFLDALPEKSFDLIFLDILMPKANGFEVLFSLESLGVDTPVIVLSAVSQREAVMKAFQAGVKSYLIKPLDPEKILKKTAEILKANF